jgi:hypothetical protein
VAAIIEDMYLKIIGEHGIGAPKNQNATVNLVNMDVDLENLGR